MGRQRAYDVRLLANNESWAVNKKINASHVDPCRAADVRPDMACKIRAECRQGLHEQGVRLRDGCELVEAALPEMVPTDAILRAFRKWGTPLHLVYKSPCPISFWLPPQLRSLARNLRGPTPQQATTDKALQRFVVEHVYNGKVDASSCGELAAGFQRLTGAVKGLHGLRVREPRATALEERLTGSQSAACWRAS